MDFIIMCEQLFMLFFNIELGGNICYLDYFLYVQKGVSIYLFGLVQFDVGGNLQVRCFLCDNGFIDGDIVLLFQQGGLSIQQLVVFDVKLQVILQVRMDEFINVKLDSVIECVDQVIVKVCVINLVVVDVIVVNLELQLVMVDYDNQFGSMGLQFISYLVGNVEKLQGGIVQVGNLLMCGDVQNFVDVIKYGIQLQVVVVSCDECFDWVMVQIGIIFIYVFLYGLLGMFVGNGVLVNGSKGDEVQVMQQKLFDLGYLGKDGKLLVVDGDFGFGIVEVVKQFQCDYQFIVDGKVGGVILGVLEVVIQQCVQVVELIMVILGYVDYLCYQQVVDKLEVLEEQCCQGGLLLLFNDCSQFENVVGQVVYEFKVVGMSQVDIVLVWLDNQGVFVVQGQFGDFVMYCIYVDLLQVVNQNLQDSMWQSQVLDNELLQWQIQEQIQMQ